MSMFEKTVLKLGNKAFYIFGGIIILLFTIIIVFAFSGSGSKTPISCDEANSIISKSGYEVSDITNLYDTKNNPQTKVIGVETDTMHLEFFELENSNTADNIYGQFTTLMLDYRKGNYYDGTAGYSNYKMYWMSSNNVYYTIIRVENTVLYAYCDEDCKDSLFKILTDMGYES